MACSRLSTSPYFVIVSKVAGESISRVNQIWHAILLLVPLLTHRCRQLSGAPLVSFLHTSPDWMDSGYGVDAVTSVKPVGHTTLLDSNGAEVSLRSVFVVSEATLMLTPMGTESQSVRAAALRHMRCRFPRLSRCKRMMFHSRG